MILCLKSKPFGVLVESDVIVSIRAPLIVSIRAPLSETTLLLAARMPNDFDFSVFEMNQ